MEKEPVNQFADTLAQPGMRDWWHGLETPSAATLNCCPEAESKPTLYPQVSTKTVSCSVRRIVSQCHHTHSLD